MAITDYIKKRFNAPGSFAFVHPQTGVQHRIIDAPANLNVLESLGGGGTAGADVTMAEAQKMLSGYEAYQAAQRKAQEQTYEQRYGSVAAKAAGQPYTRETGAPTFEQKFYKERGRFPTREEMIAGGVSVAQPATKSDLYGTRVPGPSALKYYTEAEIQRVPGSPDIYLKPGVPIRWPQAAVGAGAATAAAPTATPAAQYYQAEGAAPSAAAAPAAEPVKIAAAPAPEKTYTLPDGTKLTGQQMVDILAGKGYEEPAVIDKAAKRKELAATAGLDKTITEINELDKQINEVETAIRNRSEDLRSKLRDTEATESDIQRELTAQLRPLDRKYRDLMAIRGVKAEVYNRGMTNINQEISDLESKRAEELSDRERKVNLMLKAYGIKTAEEEKESKQQQWIAEQSLKLQKGETITLPDGTIIKGVKTADRETYTYDYKDPKDGHTYRITADEATGKELFRNDMGVTYKSGEGEGEFTDQEKRKLEQAGLADAPRSQKLDYLYGEDQTTPLTEAKKLKAVVSAVQQYKDDGKSKKEVEKQMRADNKLSDKDVLPSTLQRALDFVFRQ